MKMEAEAGIEPAHTGFADQCITTLLPRHGYLVLCEKLEKLNGLGVVSTRLTNSQGFGIMGQSIPDRIP